MGKTYTLDYSLFGFLIITTKDIDSLYDKKIVVNYLGDNKAATSFVNNLNTNISVPGIDSNYHRIFKDMNAFYVKLSQR